MEGLKLVTPFDILKGKIEKDKNLSSITNTVMDYLSNNFVLNQNCTVHLSSKLLTWDEQTLLKYFFKQLGWKITLIQKEDMLKVIVTDFN